jgi:hypothetical protein
LGRGRRLPEINCGALSSGSWSTVFVSDYFKNTVVEVILPEEIVVADAERVMDIPGAQRVGLRYGVRLHRSP